MSAKDNKLHALILSIYRDLAEAVVESLTPEQREEVMIGDQLVKLEIVAGDPSQEPAFQEAIDRAQVIAIVARFLDVLSMEKIKGIYRHLPNETDVPVAIFLLRDKGEVDFKISCPSCGQKLWLRDADVGRHGRCPNCKKPFVIQSQGDHLKTQLMLPDSVPVLSVTHGDLESFGSAMGVLMDAAGGGLKPIDSKVGAEAIKNATMRIQIQES